MIKGHKGLIKGVLGGCWFRAEMSNVFENAMVSAHEFPSEGPAREGLGVKGVRV